MRCFVLIPLLFTALGISSFISGGDSSSQLRPSFFKRNTVNTYYPIHNFQNITRSGAKNIIPESRAKRGTIMNNDPLCYRSPILQNVTLRGGIEAGYFRKLAEHVAMKLCVELCCEEKGCDAAFMWGKHCYGVQCFSHELCEAVLAKQKINEPIMVSHVTFQGETLHKEKLSKKHKEECISTEVQAGVALRGGLKAGNFTHLGTVTNMRSCTNLCCAKNRCDLAIVLSDQCFALACFTPSLCEMTRAFSQTYKPKMSYILKSAHYAEQPQKNITTNHYEQRTSYTGSTKTKQHTPKSSAHQLSKHQKEMPENNKDEEEGNEEEDEKENTLNCKNSPIYINSTLKGGFKAGNYTNLGRVENMGECVRLCCGNSQCNAALMLEKNCFFVECKNADGCLPVKAKTTHSLAALNPRVSFITSRSEEAPLPNQKTNEGVCRAGVISYDVSLKGGSMAGNFTPHGRVPNMEGCIRKCCTHKGCDLAMMLKDVCYTVTCKSEKLCEKKHMSLSNGFRPKIAYVFKDKKNVIMTAGNKSKTTSTGSSKYKHMNVADTRLSNAGKISLENHNRGHQMSESDSSTQGNEAIDYSSQPNYNSNVLYDKTADNSTNVQYLLKLLQSNFGKPRTNVSSQQEIDDDVIDEVVTTQDDVPVNNSHAQEEIGPKYNFESKNSEWNTNKSNNCLSASSCSSNDINQNHLFIQNIKNNNFNFTDQKRTSGRVKSKDRNNIKTQAHKVSSIIKTASNRKEMLAANNTLVNNKPSSNVITYPQKEPVVKSLLHLVHAANKNVQSDDPSCTYSEPLHNATLRGNLHSGQFTDRGAMDGMQQCIRLCCMLKGCDLAFMLEKKCFTVKCKNQKLCEPVQSKSNRFSPTLCYVLVKSVPS